jgi:hypothetical protein
MPEKVDQTWNVLEHGPLQQLADNLWRIEGALPGMSLRRTMTVVRRDDGLVLHSVIAVADDVRARIEALGAPRFMLIPNGGHRLDAPAYKARYPELRVFCPRGSREAVAERVPVDGTYEDFPGDPAIHLETLHGIGDREGAMIVRSADGTTVVISDAMMNMDPKRDWMGKIFTVIMGSAPGPRVSRFARWKFITDQGALKADFLRFAAIPDLVRLVVSHEKVASGPDAAAALQTAATFLHD